MIKVLIVEDQQILLDTFTSAMHNYEDIRVVALRPHGYLR